MDVPGDLLTGGTAAASLSSEHPRRSRCVNDFSRTMRVATTHTRRSIVKRPATSNRPRSSSSTFERQSLAQSGPKRPRVSAVKRPPRSSASTNRVTKRPYRSISSAINTPKSPNLTARRPGPKPGFKKLINGTIPVKKRAYRRRITVPLVETLQSPSIPSESSDPVVVVVPSNENLVSLPPPLHRPVNGYRPKPRGPQKRPLPSKPRSQASLNRLGSRYKSTRSKPQRPLTSKMGTGAANSKTPIHDIGAQCNHDAFVNSFSIPTQLYRYLAERHRQRPLYMDRCLSYLRPSAPSFSTNGTTTTTDSRASLESIIERLRRKTTPLPKTTSNRFTRKTNGLDLDIRELKLSPSPTPYWPHEIEVVFEGFYDSEKELDWVTVEASVGLYFRFGWAWRHKCCPPDTLVTPFTTAVPLSCHHPRSGSEHVIRGSGCAPDSSSSCRFQPLSLIGQTKSLTSGAGRMTSGQLELRISATERRWLKRPDLSRSIASSTASEGSLDAKGSGLRAASTTPSGAIRKGCLSAASYPVQYSTAPLPLFYPATVSKFLGESHPFLLTPGLYELRLGVDRGENGLPDKAVPVHSETAAVTMPNGTDSHPHETTGSIDSLAASSTSDFATTGSTSGTTLTSVESDSGFLGPGVVDAIGATSGRVEWRRIRFPNASTSNAVDEYARWPRLKFRVNWLSETSQLCNGNQHATRVNGLDGGKEEGDDECWLHRNGNDAINGVPSSKQSPLRNGTPRKSLKSMTNTRHISSATRTPLTIPTAKSLPNGHHQEPTVEPSTNPVAKEPVDTGHLFLKPLRKPSTRPHLPDPPVLPPRPVVYRFMHQGVMQQCSESKDLVCPWCQLDCWRARKRGPEALLVHLRTCHPRFRFKATWSPSRLQLSLEVSLNEVYDGSNDCGLRRWGCGPTVADVSTNRRLIAPGQLLGGWTGLGLSDSEVDIRRDEARLPAVSPSLSLAGFVARVPGPVRRLPYTHLIFWRDADRAIDQPLDPTLSVRPMAVGHNRVYYHTRSTQPIRACEFDCDSEAEDAPDWLCQHYQRKVEEFTDVNQGEKQLMQLWNALLLSIAPSDVVVCDAQLVHLAAYFLHRYALHIHQRRLRCNLLLHFTNLVDYGLLSAGQLRQLVFLYDKLVSNAATLATAVQST